MIDRNLIAKKIQDNKIDVSFVFMINYSYIQATSTSVEFNFYLKYDLKFLQMNVWLLLLI